MACQVSEQSSVVKSVAWIQCDARYSGTKVDPETRGQCEKDCVVMSRFRDECDQHTEPEHERDHQKDEKPPKPAHREPDLRGD